MKILIVSQYFYPENLPINFIAKQIKKSFGFVEVFTGKPNYPQGKFYEGYGFFSKIHDEVDSINVYRIPLIPRRMKIRSIGLFLNYLSFMIISSFFIPFLLRHKKYDLIIVYANSPITKAIPAIVLSKIRKIPVILWVQDLWPESLNATGYKLPKFIEKLVFYFVKFIYKNVQCIACQSRSFIEKISSDHNIDSSKLAYLPNTIDDIFYKNNSQNFQFQNFEQSEGDFNILFSGNMGEAQSLETILNSAVELRRRSIENIKIILAGNGSKFQFCRDFISKNNLTNVTLLGQVSLEKMPSLIEKCSALLITLKDEEIFNLTIPNKLQSYLASGKPILGSLKGEGAKIIRESNSGIVCDPEDYKNLTINMINLSNQSKKELEQFSENGLKYFHQNFKYEVFENRLKKIINETLENHDKR